MKSDNEHAEVELLKHLAERLSTCPEVTKYDEGEDEEAWTMAHAFTDLSSSFATFKDKLLPQLLRDEASPARINTLLLEIGEEFRHILYHIKDPRFYRYLVEEDEPGPF